VANLLQWAGNKVKDIKDLAFELMHPRGPDGRFIEKWGVKKEKADKIAGLIGGSKLRTFPSDAAAGQYAFNAHHAAATRGKGSWNQSTFVREFGDVNDRLRAGKPDEVTESFGQMMDGNATTLDQDLIVTRMVNPEALGLGPDAFTPKPMPEAPDRMVTDVEDMTGKIIADRGYTSGGIGTEYNNPAGKNKIRMVLLTPAGTKVTFPGSSQTDRQVAFQRDQQFQVTFVDRDGQGGHIMYAIALPATPGATPAPLDVTAGERKMARLPLPRDKNLTADQMTSNLDRAKGQPLKLLAQQAGVPDTGTDEEIRQRIRQAAADPKRAPGVVPAPGQAPAAPAAPAVDNNTPGQIPAGPNAPAPRAEQVQTEAMGGGGAPAAPAAPGTPAAPEAPGGGAPETPQMGAGHFRRLVQERDLPRPSSGKRRSEWNNAYNGITTGRKQPADMLRELETDIAVNRRRGDVDGTDTELDRDIEAQEALADAIAESFDIPRGAKPAPGAARPEVDLPDLTDEQLADVNAGRAVRSERVNMPAPEEPRGARRPTSRERAEQRAQLRETVEGERGKRGVAEPEALSEDELIRRGEERRRNIKETGETFKEIQERRRRERGAEPVPAKTPEPEPEKEPAKKPEPTSDEDAARADRARKAEIRKEVRSRPKPPETPEQKADREEVTKLAERTNKRIEAENAAADKAMHDTADPWLEAAGVTWDDLGTEPSLQRAVVLLTADQLNNKKVSKKKAADRLREIGEPGSPLHKVADQIQKPAARKAAAPKALTDASVEKEIRATYAEMRPSLGEDGQPEFLGLADVRERLDVRGVPRADQDRVLLSMLKGDDVRIIPVANRKALTQRDRDAALIVGGENGQEWHAISIAPKAAAKPKRLLVRELDALSPEQVAEAAREGRISARTAVRHLRARPYSKENEAAANSLVNLVTPTKAETAARIRKAQKTRDRLDADQAKAAARKAAPRKAVPRDDRVGVGPAGVFSRDPKIREAATAGIEQQQADKSAFLANNPEVAALETVADEQMVRAGRKPPVAPNRQLAPEKAKRADVPLNPERASTYEDALANEFVRSGQEHFGAPEGSSAAESISQINRQVADGDITPNQALEMLENDIDFNEDELRELERDLRANPGIAGSLRDGIRDKKAEIKAEQDASKFLRKHFESEPAITNPELEKLKADVLPDDMGSKLRRESAEMFKENLLQQDIAQLSAEEIKGLKGANAEEVFDNALRLMLENELKSRGIEVPGAKKPATPKPVKAAPTPAKGWESPNLDAIGEGLDRSLFPDKMWERLQADLDNPKNTPAKVGRELDTMANKAGMGPLNRRAILYGGRADRPLTPEEQADFDHMGRQAEEWTKLADRLKATRRKRATAPKPETPTLAPEEDASLKQAAKLTGIPEADLKAQAVEKKETDAPASDHAKGIVDLLKVVGSDAEGNALLQRRTKKELQDIAKAAEVEFRPRDTKAQLQDAIVRRLVTGRLTHAAYVRGASPVTSRPGDATPRAELMARLSDFDNPPSREDSHKLLEGMPKLALKAMAKDLNVPGYGGMTMQQLRDAIVQATSGRRRDSIAIRGFRGARPDSPENDLPGMSKFTPGPAAPSPLPSRTGNRELDVDNMVRAAYREAIAEGDKGPFGRPANGREARAGDYVMLDELRAKIGNQATRQEVDDALRRLNKESDAGTTPQEDQKRLTPRQREAAISTNAGQADHMVRIGDPAPKTATRGPVNPPSADDTPEVAQMKRQMDVLTRGGMRDEAPPDVPETPLSGRSPLEDELFLRAQENQTPAGRRRQLRQRAVESLQDQGFNDPRPEMIEDQMEALRRNDEQTADRIATGGADKPPAPGQRFTAKGKEYIKTGRPWTRDGVTYFSYTGTRNGKEFGPIRTASSDSKDQTLFRAGMGEAETPKPAKVVAADFDRDVVAEAITKPNLDQADIVQRLDGLNGQQLRRVATGVNLKIPAKQKSGDSWTPDALKQYIAENVHRDRTRWSLAGDRPSPKAQAGIDRRRTARASDQTSAERKAAVTQVQDAAKALERRPGDWVSIADVRERLSGMSREDQDAALTKLATTPGVHVIPWDNRKGLTQRDHDAAIRIGGDDAHAIRFDPPETRTPAASAPEADSPDTEILRMSIPELRELAKSRGITGWETLGKDALLDALLPPE
jgi:hypothetical protein